jgi:hypothetical protein
MKIKKDQRDPEMKAGVSRNDGQGKKRKSKS